LKEIINVIDTEEYGLLLLVKNHVSVLFYSFMIFEKYKKQGIKEDVWS